MPTIATQPPPPPAPGSIAAASALRRESPLRRPLFWPLFWPSFDPLASTRRCNSSRWAGLSEAMRVLQICHGVRLVVNSPTDPPRLPARLAGWPGASIVSGPLKIVQNSFSNNALRPPAPAPRDPDSPPTKGWVGTLHRAVTSASREGDVCTDVCTLVGFPYSGSGVAMFAPWKSVLPPSMTLMVACPPGREHRLDDPLVDDLSTAADQIAEELTRCLPPGPVTLLGCSLGATIAYEVARRLLAAGRPIDHLIAAAAPAPQIRRRRGRMHQLPDDAFLAEIQSRYGAVPAAVFTDAQLRRLVLPGLRAEFTMAETYRPGPGQNLQCGVLTLTGKADAMVKRRDVYRWRALGRSYRHRSFDGDHYFVRTRRQQVLRTIVGYLERATSAAPGSKCFTPSRFEKGSSPSEGK